MYSSYSTLQRKQLTKQVYTDTQSTYLLVYAPGRHQALEHALENQLHRKFRLVTELAPALTDSVEGVLLVSEDLECTSTALTYFAAALRTGADFVVCDAAFGFDGSTALYLSTQHIPCSRCAMVSRKLLDRVRAAARGRDSVTELLRLATAMAENCHRIPQSLLHFRRELCADDVFSADGKRALILSHELTMTGAPIVLTSAVPVLRSIRENAHGGEMTRVRAGSGDGEWVYCMLERGRDYYVYAYMPLTRALDTTPKNLLFTLVAYAMVLFIVIMIRWRLKHVYQEEQLRREQSYQQQLKDAARKAESANRAKTEFLQRMSHDIRTPINGIRGMVEIGDHYSEDLAKQAECRRKIWDASTLLLELVNEVLDMGKLESGEILLESCPFNVIELKDGIRQTMERAAAERGITMTDRTEVKHTALIGSPLHLKRLLMNILSNAIKYNKDNGSIDLTCREVRNDGKTAWIEFICADTGIGMSEEFQKHLYEPFTQEHSDARTSYNGTGLGMAITKSLVEKMGGTIECRSKLGEGTTYCITIPFAIDSSAAPRVEETAALPAATPEGMHVLLAEDNELNIEIAVFVLENAGVTVTKAVNGQDALDQFAASAPGTFDAIIMDVMMPVMDGYQATRAIRQLDRPDAGSIPILAMTANAFVEDRRRAYEAGMNEHLTKPLEPEVVLRTLAKYRSK